ncbi:MAG: terminase [Burkholderiales bacterium]|nr:terminase [Burkholderiales bacterium]
MAGLTPKREAFAAGLAQGLSQAEAYRRAFPRSAAWKDAAVWSKASLLAGDGKVRERVAEIGAKAAAANEFTVAQHLSTLLALRDEARHEGQFGPAIKAEELRGKCAGFYTEKVEHNLGTVGPDWRALLRKPED